MINLDTPVNTLRMIGAVYAGRLKKLGIFTLRDLLYHIPFRYEDYSNITKIQNIKPDTIISVIGKIENIKNIFTKYGKKIQKAQISDETGISI